MQDWKAKLINDSPSKEYAVLIMEAINLLFTKDMFLISNNANERSITFKLAEYLSYIISSMDIDCEYNLNDGVPKRLLIRKKDNSKNEDGFLVYPDIVIHKRGRKDYNVLVIEIKKSTSNVSNEWDIQKIKGYIEDLDYKFGLYLEIECGMEQTSIKDIQWFNHE